MKRALLLSTLLIIFSLTAFSQNEATGADSTTRVSGNVEGTTFDTESLDDEDVTTGGYVPGLLHSSRDIYSSNTSYAFSIAYFKSRGVDSKYQSIAINGLEMENAVTGRASYSQWGGLNRVFRWPENVGNLDPVTFLFGDVGGSTNYSTRASSYRHQFHANYSLCNRNYNNRIMLTYASGLLKNGWSVAASASTRFGSQLSYVDGSSYTGFAYFLAAEKRFNNEHALNLTVWGSPTSRSLQANSTQEVYDLTGDHYYNSNWGWYDGKKRNARIRDTYEPVFMLSHFYTPENGKLQITSNIASTFGRQSTTSLNWNNVPDPRPDYYRYLPSYFNDDPELQAWYTEQWTHNKGMRQLDWDHMYEVNQLAAAIDEQAQYIVENRVIDHVMVAASSNLVANLSDNIKLSAGVDIRGYRQRNYKTINDLLGGAYWLN